MLLVERNHPFLRGGRHQAPAHSARGRRAFPRYCMRRCVAVKPFPNVEYYLASPMLWLPCGVHFCSTKLWPCRIGQVALLTRTSHYRAKGHPAIREGMRGKADRGPHGERDSPLLGGAPAGRGGYGGRDQVGRSDNTASRTCRFEVSAEQLPRDSLFSAAIHESLSSNRLYSFSRNWLDLRSSMQPQSLTD